jgi:uncharacterized protein YozE (UPF0346 family)
MENEDGNFDVEDWVEEGIKDAEGKLDEDLEPAPAEEELTPAEEKPEKEQEQETKEEQQAESTIEKVLQRVPVEQVAKIRKGRREANERADAADARAEAAEKRAKEAERQLAEKETPTEGEISGDPLAELEDDDLVRAGTIRQAIKQEVDKVSQRIQNERAVQDAQVIAENAIRSEQQFAKDTPDYNEITSSFLELQAQLGNDLLTDKEKSDMLSDENPAKKYYELAKSKLSGIQKSLGITPTTTSEGPKTEVKAGEEEGEEELNDDNIIEELYS